VLSKPNASIHSVPIYGAKRFILYHLNSANRQAICILVFYSTTFRDITE